MNIGLDYAARSDVGLVRSNNQDSGFASSHLLVVADGMGGHAGGDVASSVTVGRLVRLEADPPATDIVAHLEDAIVAANQRILERSREDGTLTGMGTTVTALLRSENKFALAHIGDSRAYQLRDGNLTQVTKDHTLVQHLIDQGRMTPEEAERSPQRSVLMRALGDVDVDQALDLSLRPAKVGDRWMICSDGLSGLVSDDTIEDVLLGTPDPGKAADELVRLALAGGGSDNVTCIVADVVDLDALGPGQSGPSTSPQIVGAAAADRNRPSAGTGSAARAAALTRPVPAASDDTDDVRPMRRSAWPTTIALLVIAAILAGLGFLGYRWTQSQYFVGTDGTSVVVYQGIDESLGPVTLYHEEEVTNVQLADLPDVYRQRVEGTITADDMTDARRIVQSLADLTETTTDGYDTSGASDDSSADVSGSSGSSGTSITVGPSTGRDDDTTSVPSFPTESGT